MNTRLLSVIVFVLSLLAPSYSQISTAPATHVIVSERTRVDNAGDQLHRVANEFATKVGNFLKQNGPLRVDKIYMEIVCEEDSITLRYLAYLGQCSLADSDFSFDRRGALTFAGSRKAADNDAQTRAKSQADDALLSFFKKYGRAKVRTIIISKSTDGCPRGTFGAISETFIIVKRL